MPDYNSYEMTPKETRRYYLIAVSILLLLGQIFYQSLICSALLSALSVPCKGLYARHLAENRRAALEHSFRDLLCSLSASFSTGRQMPEALKEGLEAMRLIYPADAPIVRELEHMTARLFRSRDDETALLDDFANRSRSEDIRNFVDAYFICRTTGGDMEIMIAKASALIIDKIEIKRERRTLTAQKRLEANILLLLPAVMLVFLQLLSPAYIAALYDGLWGRLVMTAALGLMALSYAWNRRLTNVETQR
ncbi:MAG: type II secretion system F family protein [Clostridiales Family XIII bacterium]|jgi:tight adherence protein B|nr:type II secretion system F family protein [Clostridiales Family XIII bacterium]